MLYFAYGSNMLSVRLRQRTPSAQALGPASLRGHVLKFNKQGRDGSGKGNIEVTGQRSDVVHGVVFRINPSEKYRLDQAESLGYGYAQKRVRVTTPLGQALEGLTYYALRIDNTLHPYDWYKAFLMHGALEHDIPKSYRSTLEAVQAIKDPNLNRCQQNLAILNLHRNTAMSHPDR